LIITLIIINENVELSALEM